MNVAAMALVIALFGVAAGDAPSVGATPKTPIAVRELLSSEKGSLGEIVYVSGSVRFPYALRIHDDDCTRDYPSLEVEIDTDISDRPDVRKLVAAAAAVPLGSGRGAHAVIAVRPYYPARNDVQHRTAGPWWLELVSVYSVEGQRVTPG